MNIRAIPFEIQMHMLREGCLTRDKWETDHLTVTTPANKLAGI